MIDHPQVTAYATQEALASGLEHDSEAFRDAVKQTFHQTMAHLKAQAEAVEPTPEYFRPPPPPPPQPQPQTRAAMTSPLLAVKCPHQAMGSVISRSQAGLIYQPRKKP